MKSKLLNAAIVGWCTRLLLLAPSLWGQVLAVPSHTGVPHDWSEQHIVFSLDGLARYPEVLQREPRVRNQFMHRFSASGQVVGSADRADDNGTRQQRDGNVPASFAPVNLNKGHIAASMFPAKYSFDPAAPPSCNDYVVFGLNIAGANNGQANLVALNNLYSNCTGSPTVYFAYNVTTSGAGKVFTSPVISEDGTRIAFIESLGTSSFFHVLTFTAGQGTITHAVTPSAAQMTTLAIASVINTSGIWIDYASDTAYVGSNNGKVYAIQPVFTSTAVNPPVLLGAPWPVVAGVNQLSPPVLDNRLNILMIGSRDANLYQINIANGAVAAVLIGRAGATSPGVLAAPIVDVTNGTTFAVSANDGTSGVLVEVDTSTLTRLGTGPGRIGLAAKSGTRMTLYEPAFDNNYFNDPSTGTLYACGTKSNDTSPWEYAFGFTGRVMNTPAKSAQSLLTSTAARCSGFTEFFNPNINGGTDFIFFGLTQDCTGPGTSGCVNAQSNGTFTITPAAITGGPSGIVIDNDDTTVGSHIYFTAEGANTAYQLTQNGLN